MTLSHFIGLMILTLPFAVPLIVSAIIGGFRAVSLGLALGLFSAACVFCGMYLLLHA